MRPIRSQVRSVRSSQGQNKAACGARGRAEQKGHAHVGARTDQGDQDCVCDLARHRALLSRGGVEVITAHAEGEEAAAGGQHRDPDAARGCDSRVAPVEAVVR